MGVGVEAAGTGVLHRPQERERRGRGPDGTGLVVAAGRCRPARDLVRPVDGFGGDHDVVADPGVVFGGLEHPAAAGLFELRPQKDGVVRLVPGDPAAHGRDDRAVSAVELS